MKLFALNLVFIGGISAIVASAFMVAIPFGLFVLGCPLVAFSIHVQRKLVKK
jgi:uncharacterized membrane protein